MIVLTYLTYHDQWWYLSQITNCIAVTIQSPLNCAKEGFYYLAESSKSELPFTLMLLDSKLVGLSLT